MINSEDNKKRMTRLKRFNSIYIVPIVTSVLFIIFSYFVLEYYHLNSENKFFAYLISVAIGFFLFFRNRFRWLKLSDRTFIHIKELKNSSDTTFQKKNSYVNEPKNYETEFPKLLFSDIFGILCGLVMIGVGVYLISDKRVIVPLVLAALGIFVLYFSIKSLYEPKIQLKIAKTGLWTNELGFKPWSEIKKTEIIIKGKGTRHTTTYLEIYLQKNNTAFPDEQLSITYLKDSQKIKPMIDELCDNKKKSSR